MSRLNDRDDYLAGLEDCGQSRSGSLDVHHRVGHVGQPIAVAVWYGSKADRLLRLVWVHVRLTRLACALLAWAGAVAVIFTYRSNSFSRRSVSLLKRRSM